MLPGGRQSSARSAMLGAALLLAVLASAPGCLGRLVLGDSHGRNRSAEAACALDTLPKYLLQDDAAGRRLHIVDLDDWVDGDFVRRLPFASGMTVSFSKQARLASGHADDAKTIFLVALGNRTDIQGLALSDLTYRSRLLVWVSVKSTAVPHKLLQNLTDLALGTPIWKVRLAVTSSVDRSTRFFAMPKLRHIGTAEAVAREVDRWTEASGWQRGAKLFPPYCTKWRPSPGSKRQAYIVEDRNNVLTKAVGLSFLKAVSQHRLQGRPFSTKVADDDYYDNVWPECRVSAVLSQLMLRPYALDAFSFVPWGLGSTFAVVPYGMVHPHTRSPLSRMAVGFTLAVWCAALVTLAAVTVALWLQGCQGHAPLNALAPLLTQPPPQARLPERQRPLLGVWLLASVVVSAAYQGQILSELTVPDPVAQINTVKEIVESNLTLLLREDLFEVDWAKNVQLVELQRSLLSLAVDVATHRNACAVVDDLSVLLLTPLLRAKQIHVFLIPGLQSHRGNLMTAKGSPVESSIREMLSRVRAAGLEKLWLERATEEWVRAQGLGNAVVDYRPFPLTWNYVKPAFCLLDIGLGLGASVLLLEVLVLRIQRGLAARHERTRAFPFVL